MQTVKETIYFSLEESAKAATAAQALFGEDCAVVGLGDNNFMAVQEGDGVNCSSAVIATLGDWWSENWNAESNQETA